MSDVPQQKSEGAKTLDFTGVTVLGLPSGAGIVSINADATPAQTISGMTGPAPPLTVTDDGIGGHALAVVPFAAGQAGIASDPGAAAATDYLAADNTFKPIPAGGITSINADATPAQTISGMTGPAPPLTVTDDGIGGHAIAVVPFAAGQAGIASDPGAAGATDYLAADNTFKPITQIEGENLTNPYSGLVIFDTAVNGIVGDPGIAARTDFAFQTLRITMTPGQLKFILPIYINNAAAIGGGLVAGNLYRTGADPDLIAVVH